MGRLSFCGWVTRKYDWRVYKKGTHVKSPKANMKPKPSWTMSIVVRTASFGKEENLPFLIWPRKIHQLSVPTKQTHCKPHTGERVHLREVATVKQVQVI